MIQFSCPECNRVYRRDEEYGGKRVRCRSCNTRFRVPVGEEGVGSGRSPLVFGGAAGLAAVLLVIGLVAWLRFPSQENPEQVVTEKPQGKLEDSAPMVRSTPEQKKSDNFLSSPEPKVKTHVPQPDKVNVLYQEATGLARFTFRMTQKPEEGERFAMFVLLAPAGGPALDETSAAAHYRGNLAFRYSPVTKGSYSEGSLGGPGVMWAYYNQDGSELSDGTVIRFPLPEVRPGAKLSAGVGAFKTVNGNYQFTRFITPISTLGAAKAIKP